MPTLVMNEIVIVIQKLIVRAYLLYNMDIQNYQTNNNQLPWSKDSFYNKKIVWIKYLINA